jgi:tRNA pseudouridine55 synthase
VNGLLVIDKPLRMTSRDAVNMAWRWLPRGTRIGHTGTLDPLANGVLVLCIGVATRLAEYVQRMEKVYRAQLCFGVCSSTDDGEGRLTPHSVDVPPNHDKIATALAAFVGRIEQVPPDHSAAKVTGRRAYTLARQGKELSLPPRSITVHAITLLDYAYPRLDLEIRCGKGTYIRSLARDLGERLGCGAYLEALRRTRVGHFLASEALSLEEPKDFALARLLPLVEAVRDLPALALPDETLNVLRTGQGISVPEKWAAGAEIALLSSCGSLVAVGQVDAERGLIVPRKVFPSTER